MQIREQHNVFKNIDTPLIYEIDFTRSDLLKIQITGEGSCSIKVYGRLNKQLEYTSMIIIQDKDFDMIDTIIGKGVYTISATGYQQLKIDVESTDNTLICIANEVVES